MAPTELEDIMQRHPAVQECLVYGKPDDEVQELISAVVVLKPGKKVRDLVMEFKLALLSKFVERHSCHWPFFDKVSFP